MYRKLTDKEVHNLTNNIQEGEFIISHVGDGEYSCNIFGNIYSSYWQALEKAREKSKTLDIYTDDSEYFICENYGGNYYSSHLTLPKTARLTKEKLNIDFCMSS